MRFRSKSERDRDRSSIGSNLSSTLSLSSTSTAATSRYVVEELAHDKGPYMLTVLSLASAHFASPAHHHTTLPHRPSYHAAPHRMPTSRLASKRPSPTSPRC